MFYAGAIRRGQVKVLDCHQYEERLEARIRLACRLGRVGTSRERQAAIRFPDSVGVLLALMSFAATVVMTAFTRT